MPHHWEQANRVAAAENYNANQALVRGPIQNNPDVAAARSTMKFDGHV